MVCRKLLRATFFLWLQTWAPVTFISVWKIPFKVRLWYTKSRIALYLPVKIIMQFMDIAIFWCLVVCIHAMLMITSLYNRCQCLRNDDPLCVWRNCYVSGALWSVVCELSHSILFKMKPLLGRSVEKPLYRCRCWGFSGVNHLAQVDAAKKWLIRDSESCFV